MFHIRPIILHFALWLLLAPLFLLELRAFEQLQQTLALQERAGIATLRATVTGQRMGSRGPELRYQFQTDGSDTLIEAMNTTGWGETWVPVSQEVWQQARTSGEIAVMYLAEHPQANQPIGRVGSPIGDSMFAWILFLAVDLIWLLESFLIIRNYLRSQTAAERRELSHMRFWRTAPIPTAVEHYARASKRVR